MFLHNCSLCLVFLLNSVYNICSFSLIWLSNWSKYATNFNEPIGHLSTPDYLYMNPLNRMQNNNLYAIWWLEYFKIQLKIMNIRWVLSFGCQSNEYWFGLSAVWRGCTHSFFFFLFRHSIGSLNGLLQWKKNERMLIYFNGKIPTWLNVSFTYRLFNSLK